MNDKPLYKRIPRWGWLLGIPVALMLISLALIKVGLGMVPEEELGRLSQEQEKKQTKVEEKQVKATINFTGTKFVITNANDFDWKRAKITINEKYSYEAPTMGAGATYEVGAAQFTDRNQTRFNPFETKPAELRIYVREPVSEDWYGDLR